MLSIGDFSALVKNGVLIAFDLVCRDANGQVLLGLRENAPAKGYWFVPGGRIHKGETMPQALARVTQAELGVSIPAADFQFLGLYDHIYPENFRGDEDFGTHYVIIALQFKDTDGKLSLGGNDQNREFRFAPVAQLLADPEVHSFTKSYFNTNAPNELGLKTQ